MKAALALLAALALGGLLLAAAPADFEAVRRADQARISATIAADKAALEAVISPQLSYAHSSGKHDTRDSYIASIVGGHTKYFSIAYESLDFSEAADGIVLMTGRCLIKSSNDGKDVNNYLSFLAVWRREAGVWRFLAWQSNHLPLPGK